MIISKRLKAVLDGNPSDYSAKYRADQRFVAKKKAVCLGEDLDDMLTLIRSFPNIDFRGLSPKIAEIENLISMQAENLEKTDARKKKIEALQAELAELRSEV